MQLDFYEKKLDRIHGWIENADTKTSIFLALEGGVATFALPYLFNVITICNFGSLIFGGATLFFLFLSIWKSIEAIRPNTAVATESKSITFFGDISSQSFEDYKKQVDGCDEEYYKNDLINQCYISSKLCAKKFSNFKESIDYFYISAICAALTIIIFYVW